MHFSQLLSFIFVVLVFASNVCESQDCSNPPKTITISQSGQASFKTIQSAIDSVPVSNSQWIHIQISSGVYKEHVIIPQNKPCIYLEGAGSSSTSIEWSQYLNATLITKAANTIAKGITFVNTLSSPILKERYVTQATAARIHGDKCVFVNCAFLSVQDTLYDQYGRHYYYNCYIQGAIDFIYGDGQTIFEASTLNFSWGNSGVERDGSFTAQERDSANDPTGFVFKNCTITGTGAKAVLGRSLYAYSRVIITNSYLSDAVRPEGWNAGTFLHHESTLTFVEVGNRGPGANQAKRVRWMKHLTRPELRQFLSIKFIDKEGWMAKLPANVLN